MQTEGVRVARQIGVVDAQGRSPFWEAIGRHFFDIDFPKADYLSMVNKRFIADLMPKHPIYIPLLPKEAQAVIGEVHDQTRPAMRILADEGFECCDQVDIFEGGPVVRPQRFENGLRALESLASSREVVRGPADTGVRHQRFGEIVPGADLREDGHGRLQRVHGREVRREGLG